MSSTQKALLKKLVVTAAFFGIGVFYLIPYIWLVLTGFRMTVDTLAIPPRFIFAPTFSGFKYIFGPVRFQWYLLNSFVIASIATFVVILVAAPAAYALVNLGIRAKTFLYSIIVARMIPAVSIVVPIYLMAIKLGLLDTYQILIAIYATVNLPFAIWMMRAFFRDVPPSLREAAIIDGCSEFRVFRSVFMPISAGGALATAVFVFIACWNELLFALVLTNSKAATAPLAMVNFRTDWGIQWNAIGAGAVVLSTPVIVFAVAMQRYLIRGMTMGSVK